MTTFPPRSQSSIASIAPLETQLKIFKPLSLTAKLPIGNYDYIAIVCWKRYIGRQSKRLIRIVQENRKLEKRKK